MNKTFSSAKNPLFILLAAMLAQATMAQERGQVLFADDFDSSATFAENWRPQGGARLAPADGKSIIQSLCT